MDLPDECERLDNGVEFIRNPSGMFTARDEATGVVSQGRTKAEALQSLADALSLHAGAGTEIVDEEAYMRAIGIDPDEIPDDPKELPEFLK